MAIAPSWEESMRHAQAHIKQLEEQIANFKKQVEEKDLIIYGITEGAEEWKAKCSDLQWQMDNHVSRLQSNLQSEAVGFAEWERKNEWHVHDIKDGVCYWINMANENLPVVNTAKLYQIYLQQKERKDE